MKKLAAIFLLLLAFQEDTTKATVVEWNVRWLGRDTVGRLREIHRRERVTILPDRMVIEDQTFGMSWIIRGDLQKVWVVDRLAGRMSELTFEQIRARQDAVAAELRECADRVPGTENAEEIRSVLRGMGRYEKPPAVEAKATGRTERILERDCPEWDVVLEGDIHQITVLLDPAFPEGEAYFTLLSELGAFPETVAAELGKLAGTPLKGTMRYLFFLDRVAAEIEAVTVERQSVKPELFEPPEGLLVVPLAGFESQPAAPGEKQP